MKMYKIEHLSNYCDDFQIQLEEFVDVCVVK